VWFEWKLNGKSLPIMTALVLPATLWPLVFGETPVLTTGQTLVNALMIPVLLAGFIGPRGGGNNPGLQPRNGLGSFSASLPMATTDMVAAMLKTAALSTLSTWALVAVVIPLAVVLTGRLAKVTGWWQQASQEYHPATIVAGSMAALSVLMVWTWKRQVDRLYFGLTGQSWVATTVGFVWLVSSALLASLAIWIQTNPQTHETFWLMLPWCLGLWLLGRLLLAGWAFRQVVWQGLVEPRTAARWLAGWLLVASLLIGLLVWLVPPDVMPTHLIVLVVLFAMPMARLAAAPLALAWNRHR
jgi:hypothetical protein